MCWCADRDGYPLGMGGWAGGRDRFRFVCGGVSSSSVRRSGLPGRGATSSLLLSNIFFQLLYGVVLWWSTLLVVGW